MFATSYFSVYHHPIALFFYAQLPPRVRFVSALLTGYHVYLQYSYIFSLIPWRDTRTVCVRTLVRCLESVEEGLLGKIGGDASRLDATSW